MRFSGKLDKDILERCLNEIIRRHEILRTTFHEQDDSPVQVIHEPWEVSLPEADLRHLPEDRREEEVERRIVEEMNICFDYAELPLIRWRLYRLGEEDWIFLLIEHHFIHDGWEVMVFLRESRPCTPRLWRVGNLRWRSFPSSTPTTPSGRRRRSAESGWRKRCDTGSIRSATILTC